MGHALPEFIQGRPAVWSICTQYWVAFWELSGGRQIALGFGSAAEQPIGFADLAAYLALNPIEGGLAERQLFVRLLRAMDQTWLAAVSQQRASTSPKAG